MDRSRLFALMSKPEGPKLDFKQTLSLNFDNEKKELAKDVSAIANSKGGRGYIIFGISDKEKNIIGIEPRKYSEEQIQQIISQRCEPPVNIKFEIEDIEGKHIGILTIYRHQQKPHQIRQTGGFYIRRGSTTDMARRDEIASILQENGFVYFETMTVKSAKLEDIDMGAVMNYLSGMGIIAADVSNTILLESLGILNSEEDGGRHCPTVGGLLLFGKNPQLFLPHTGVRIVNSMEPSTVKRLRGSILNMLDEGEIYLKEALKEYDYPIEPIMEALANAMVHRDYLDIRREIVITLGYERIEISNPGALYSEDEVAGLFEELNPARRNQWLYQKLVLIDKKGRFQKSGNGLRRIQSAFEGNKKVRIISMDRRNLFKVIFPGVK